MWHRASFGFSVDTPLTVDCQPQFFFDIFAKHCDACGRSHDLLGEHNKQLLWQQCCTSHNRKYWLNAQKAICLPAHLCAVLPVAVNSKATDSPKQPNSMKTHASASLVLATQHKPHESTSGMQPHLHDSKRNMQHAADTRAFPSRSAQRGRKQATGVPLTRL